MKGIRGHLCEGILEIQIHWPKKDYNKMLREFGRYRSCPFCYEIIDKAEREKREAMLDLVAQAKARFG